jgi:hypothetical protein
MNDSVDELKINMEASERFRSTVYGMYFNTMMKSETSLLVITHKIFNDVKSYFQFSIYPLSAFGDEHDDFKNEMQEIIEFGSYPVLLVSDDVNNLNSIGEVFIGLPKLVNVE